MNERQTFIQLHPLTIVEHVHYFAETIYLDKSKIESMFKINSSGIGEVWILRMTSGACIPVSVDEFLKFNLL